MVTRKTSIACALTLLTYFIHNQNCTQWSIDHEFIMNEFRAAGYPHVFVDTTKDIYNNSTFQIKTAGGATKPIQRGKGVVQGCPRSVVVFEQGIDNWFHWIQHPYDDSSISNPVQGYADNMGASGTGDFYRT